MAKFPANNMDKYSDLDVEIATKIFKAVVIYDQDQNTHTIKLKDKSVSTIPKYSSDIDLSFLVLKYLKSNNLDININYNLVDSKIEWYCRISKDNVELFNILGATLPEVICVAALTYKKYKPDNDPPPVTDNILSVTFPKKI